MKLKSLFAAAIAAIVLASCTKEVIREVYVETPTETGVSLVKVGIKPLDLGTKAGHSDLSPTTDETKIYNFALFVFKSSGMLETSLIATPSRENNGNPKDYSSYTNGGLEFRKADNPTNPYLNDEGVLTLSSGTKLFVAIVNAPAELLAVQNEYLDNHTLNQQSLTGETLTFSDLSSIVGKYNNDVVSYVNNSSNNRGFMMTTVDTKGYEEKVLLETADGDAPQSVDLTVGRAMAKVSLGTELKGNAGTEAQLNGTLDVWSYKIINNPKAMNIIPRYESGVLISPYYYDGNVTTTKYFESHNTSVIAASIKPAEGTLQTNYIPVSTDTYNTFTYAIENANLNPKQGNSTIAIVKGQFTPGGNATIHDNPENETVKTLSKGDTFYRIWIPLYTNIITGEEAGNRYNGIYYTEDPSAYLTDYIAAKKAEMGWPDNINLAVDVYTNGVCYYRLPLYNKNSNAAAAPYTVKRNTYYKIDIESVSDAGYTDENKGGGGEPIDPELPLEPQSEISVKITVEDWEEVKQGGNL